MLLVFCVLYLITGCMSFSSGQVRCWKKPERSLKHLTAATSISLAAMLVNPYGYKLLTYFIVGNNAACKEGVQEWQPTTIYSGLGFYLIVVAVILIVFSRYKRYSMTSLVPVAVTSGLALLYVRGGIYLGIVMVFFLVDSLYMSAPEPGENKKGGLFYASIIMATAFAILAFVLFPSAVKGFDESEYLISDGMIAEIRAGDFERLYNTYNTGGYLIYKEIPVFIDSRADLYPEDVLRDGKEFQYWTCDEQEVIKKYRFDGFLIGNKDPIKKYFDLSGEYAQVYADESHSLYMAGIPEDATSKSSMNKQIKE